MSKKLSQTHNNKKFVVAITVIILAVSMLLCCVRWGIQSDTPTPYSPNGDNMDNALVNEDCWNIGMLNALGMLGENKALAHENHIIRIGDIEWLVVYKQNNVYTLWSTQSVGVASTLDEANDMLANDIYNTWINSVSNENLANYIVSTGVDAIAYQGDGIQDIPLLAKGNNVVSEHSVAKGLKMWLPSAYEVGGSVTNVIGTEAINPSSRVESFGTLNVNAYVINTGLWNVGTSDRVHSEGMLLRSTTQSGGNVILDKNGVLDVLESPASMDIYPAMHICLPSVDVYGNVIEPIQAGDINTGSKLAFGNTSNMSGEGTQANPYQVKTAQDMVAISNQVAQGNNCTGLYFEMQNDINMSNITLWAPIGKFVGVNSADNRAFCGVFDGAGHIVSNLSEFTTGLPGVFGYISGSAVLSGVGVEDSNWTTNANYAGVLVGYMDGSSMVTECYNACSVSGGNYVGGIVGSSISTNFIQNCYNTGAVAGQDYVGGIAGKASKIAYTYNIGSTIAKVGANVGGIAGQVDTVNSSFYGNSANNGKGTYRDDFADMYGVDTTLYLNAGWDFATRWTISRVKNDQFPILIQFVHNAELRIVTNISGAGAYQIMQSTTSYTDADELENGICFDLGTYLTLKAESNNGYRFVGWYHYSYGLDGEPVFTDDEVSQLATYDMGAVKESYYLEARFIEIYNVVVEDRFIGFDKYSDVAYEVEVLNNKSSTSNYYDEGSVLTITVDTTLVNLQFDALKYKLTQNGVYSSTEIPSIWVKKVVNANNIVYTLNIDKENSVFDSGNVLYMQLQFTRLFELAVGVSLTAPVDKFLATATAKWNKDGAKVEITATENGVGTRNIIRYDTNFTISQTAPSTSRVFDGWTVSIQGKVRDLTNLTGELVIDFDSNNYAGIFNFGDTDYELIVIANYSMHKYTVKVNNVLDGNRDANDSNANNALNTIVIVQDSESVNLTDTPITGVVTRDIEYDRSVTIAFLPKYHNGYQLSNVYLGGVNSTTTYDYDTPTTDVNYYSLGIDALEGDIEFTIKYSYLEVSFDVVATGLDGNELDNSWYTVEGALENVNYYTHISTTATVSGIKVNLNDDIKKNYGFNSLKVNFGDSDYTITCNLTQADYNISSYVLFTNVYKVLDIYASAKVLLAPITKDFVLKLVLQPMARNLTIVNYYEGTTTNVVEADATIVATADSDVTITPGEQYVDGAQVTVTASANNIGHCLVGFKTATTETSYKGNVNNPGTFNNDGTYVFNITQNTTVIAYYKKRTYDVQLNSNIPTLDTGFGAYTLEDQGIVLYIANQEKTLTGITTQTLSGTYGDNVSMNFLIEKDFAIGQGITIRLHKIEFYYDDEVLPREIYNKGYTNYMFTLDQDASVVKINFVYRVIQEVTITLDVTNDSTIMANGTLLKLKNTDTNESTFVVLTKVSSGVTVDMPAGNYEIEFYLPIFCQAIVDLEGERTDLGTKFDLLVTGGSTEIEIEEVQKSLDQAVTNSYIIL